MLLQDASSRLFLCLLLRARPVVAEAVLTILNGPKFFDLYVPTLGVESRIHIADILPASAATWDAEQRQGRLLTKMLFVLAVR